MNKLVSAPNEVEWPNEKEFERPDENEEVIYTLPDHSNDILRTLWYKNLNDREKSHKRRLRQRERRLANVKKKMKDTDVTVHLSWEININSVKNRMKEHMEAYPTTADGFYARFIDHTDEDTWYIVVPCNKNEKNNIHINWLYYKIYPFWDHSNKFINILAKELADVLNWDMSEEKATETINEKIIDVLKISPLDAKWIKKYKNELVNFLLQDPKLLNTFWDKKYLIYDYINKAFSNIEDNNNRY